MTARQAFLIWALSSVLGGLVMLGLIALGWAAGLVTFS
jgi:hypothetical protein